MSHTFIQSLKEAFLKTHSPPKASFFFFLFFLFFFAFCGKDPKQPASRQLKGTGLFIQKKQLFWNISVGILQDSGFQEQNVAELRPVLLESAKEAAQILRGIKIKYIIDQPLNVVFIMERTLGRGKKENLHIMKAKGLSERLAKSPLSENLSFRDSTWRSYIGQQVRYDLLLTNALIYPDNPERHKELLSGQEGILKLGLGAMPGRSAMEAYGAYLSYTRLDRRKKKAPKPLHLLKEEVRLLTAEELTQTLLVALTALIFPLQLSSIATPQKFKIFRALLRENPSWTRQWKQRLSYLRALASLHRGKAKACHELRRNKRNYNDRAPKKTKMYSPSKTHASILAREQEKFLDLCAKKW